MPRETERHQRKERRTQKHRASNQPLITSEGEKVKGKHPLLYRREKDRLTTNARKVQRPDLRLELKFLVYGRARCRKSSCDYRHPLVCRKYKSGNRCIYGNNCLYRHADGEEKPSKRSKCESTQGALAILKEKKVQGCVSHYPDPMNSIPRKAGQTRLNASAGHTIPQMEKCKQTRRHKCMFTISICSSQCNYSKKRQQFYRLVSCAENTDVHTSGKTVKLHDWPNMGRQLLVQWTTQYLSLYQNCHHLPAAARLLHQDQRNSQHMLVNPKHQQIQGRLDVPSMHAGNRCKQILICKPREAVV